MTTIRQEKATATGFTLKHTLAAAGLLLGLAIASPAAAVQCGDVIGPNVTVALSGSISCDNTTNPALTIVGPAKVDLSQFTILCNDVNQDGTPPTGLRILGQKAQVHGGFPSGCYDGVDVEGEGRHTVKNVRAESSRIHGFFITSTKNILRQNRAMIDKYGFVVGGNSNTLLDNTADISHSDTSFKIEGNNNRLRRNFAGGSNFDGFSIFGEGNKLTENEARGNGVDGFDVQEGAAKITLRKNFARNNGDDGFEISGQQHKLIENEASDNIANGILAHEASHITLLGNVALDNNQANYPTILFDLKDLTPDCSTNTWKHNTFGTASQPCIQ
jgi:hypothetical protein